MSYASPTLEAFDNIDRLLNVEMRTQGLPRGIIPRLTAVARQEVPNSYLAAQALADLHDGRIAIVTGIHFEPHFPHGEIDGPIGAAVLGHTLETLGTRADVLVEEAVIAPLEALRARLGATFGIVNTSRLSQLEVVGLADTYDAAVTIEKLGVNARGVRHSILGTCLPPEEPALDSFIDVLNATDKLTIGIGDGGNEMGFGKIFDQARAIVPRGAECRCPCGDGIVTRTATRVLLPSLVSNLGAYAIVGGLSMLCGTPGLVPSGHEIIKLIETGVREGLVEGAFVKPGLIGDDGIPPAGIEAWVNVLRTIVSQNSVVIDRDF